MKSSLPSKLSERAVIEYQKIYFQIYKKKISIGQAEREANNLINLLYLVLNTRQHEKQKKQTN